MARGLVLMALALSLGTACSDGGGGEKAGVVVPPPGPTTMQPGAQTPGNLPTDPVATAGAAAPPAMPATPGAAPPTQPPTEPALPVEDAPPTNGGRTLAPAGVCVASASARVPCHDDPDPCGIDSGFDGDEFCLPPPPPELGVQIHLGPKDYNNPTEVNSYLLGAGEEVNVYGVADIPLLEDRFYNFVQLRMRPSSHHLINRVITKQATEGFIGGFDCPGQVLNGYFVGSQTPVRDDPAHGVVAPENEGLGRVISGNSSLCINQHAYNFTEGPLLREVWINVYFMDPSEVTQEENRIVVNANVGTIPPGAQRELTASSTVRGAGRIINLYGHRHAWTDRFAVWHNDRLIYDSWDWVESVVYDFNSVTENPPINPDGGSDGAVSGVLEVQNGDEIRILCDVNNQSENTLTFSNEAYTGEMCILFGASVDATIGGLPF